MIKEDYVSREALVGTKRKGLLSKKHLFAILFTFVVASALSITSDKFIFPSIIDDSEIDEAVDERQIETEPLYADFNEPLALSFAQIKNKNRDLENYDDSLNDVDLSDSDEAMDKEVAELAKNDSQNAEEVEEAQSVGAKWISENVDKGDTISSLFSNLNIPATTLASILENREIIRNVNDLKIGAKLSFLIDSNGELLEFIQQISDKEQLRFYKVSKIGQFAYVKEKLDSFNTSDAEADAMRVNKKLVAEVKKDPVKKDEIKTDPKKQADTKVVAKKEEPKSKLETRGRLVVVKINKGETFSKAAARSGLSYSEINRILQMFKGRIQFARNIRAGDTMRVLFNKAGKGGKINAVEFSLSRGGKVSSFLNPSDGRYYDESGIKPKTKKSGFSRFPFHGKVRVTSQFNPHRRHPVTRKVRPHNGVDFGIPVGTQVVAAADGIVDIATFSRSAGYYIVLRHANGMSTVYMHLSKIQAKVGQRVKAGALIARSGNTGLSSGPHLHYEIRMNGRAVNPLKVKLETRTEVLNAGARKAFANSIKKYKKELYQSSLISKR